MRRSLLALAGLVASAMPSAAQYYPYPPQGYYPPPPPRGYYQPDPYGRGGYRGPDPYGGGGYYQRPVVIGNICYTSRGTCGTRPRPVQSPCGCNIPGFGPKRGAVISGGW
jgi:hypothetical protein